MKNIIKIIVLGVLVATSLMLCATAACTHSYTSKIETPAMPLKEGVKKYTCSMCGDTYNESIPATKKIKVLAIGNSFSSDATEYLWNIAKDGGVTTIVIGNLYIGGCSLDKHADKIKNAAADYTYYKNTDGTWTKTASTSVQTALKDEAWDIITVQQSSPVSGVPSSYSNLTYILNFLKEKEPNAKIYFHMTWAFQKDSTHSGFPTYGRNQTKMYNAIQSTLDSEVKTKKSISGIVPVGTAIQNLRSSYVGDILTRDGYHLSYDFGRYTAALTWFAYFTGASPSKVDWVPSNYKALLSSNLPVIQEAVSNAIKTPYSVTKAKITNPGGAKDGDVIKELGYNIKNYNSIPCVYLKHSYYNSTTSTHLYTKYNSDAANLVNFISTKKFTKKELPVGSIIIIDSGFRYRPDKWNGDELTTKRPALVYDTAVVIDSKWWGSYTLAGLNFAAEPVREMTNADIKHFRIYVPKNPDLLMPITADTNGDGEVNIKDAMLTLNGFLNKKGIASDLNDDCKITLIDIVKLLKSMVK